MERKEPMTRQQQRDSEERARDQAATETKYRDERSRRSVQETKGAGDESRTEVERS